MSAALNQTWGQAIAAALADVGVRWVIIAPGSRSTPLVVGVHRDERLRTVVQVDERSAGFLALGVAKGSRRPAAVVTTSGSAVANLLPSVIEADASETPLVLLTADRPERLRGADANQTIPQPGLFGARVRAAVDLPPPAPGDDALGHLRHRLSRALADTVGPVPGPVHLNVPFAKPLGPDSASADVPLRRGPYVTAPALAPSVEALRQLQARLDGSSRGVLVAGPSGAPNDAVRRLAVRTGYPTLADPLSGLRYGAETAGPPVIGAYDVVLRSEAWRRALRPDHVFRVGASPTSAVLLEWLAGLGDTPQTVVSPGGRWKDHLETADLYVRAEPAALVDAMGDPPPPDPEWGRLWTRAERLAHAGLQSRLPVADLEASALRDALSVLPPRATVVVSNSMPIRDLDTFVPHLPAPVHAVGNRGASGIDGMVSTVLGTALAAEGPVLGVLGDLALLHDGNGLLAAREGMQAVMVVLHNDGGGIFHMLPIRDHEPEFTRYFATPHGRDFRHLARLFDVPYQEAAQDGVAAAVRRALDAGGVQLVVVRFDRERNHAVRARVLDGIEHELTGAAERRPMDEVG